MTHTNTNDTPMTTSTEIAQKIDLGFDYVNLIGFSNEDELKNEYGEEFYKKFVEVFADEWRVFSLLLPKFKDLYAKVRRRGTLVNDPRKGGSQGKMLVNDLDF